MRIEKIMSHQVTTCAAQDSLEHAASLMWNSDCGCIPVVSIDNKLVGIVTDRDICMAALFQRKALCDLRVQDAMAARVLTCRASDKIEEAQRQMENEQIRRLPVIGNDDELIGIVSMADIARESARSQYKQRPDIPCSEVTATLARISTRSPERHAALTPP